MSLLTYQYHFIMYHVRVINKNNMNNDFCISGPLRPTFVLSSHPVTQVNSYWEGPFPIELYWEKFLFFCKIVFFTPTFQTYSEIGYYFFKFNTFIK